MSVELRRVRICALEEIPCGEGRVVRIADRPIAVFRSDAGVHALDNTCTHMGGPLADGLVSEATVACPLHERRFDLTSGRAVGHDCGAIASYPVEVIDGDVMLTVPVYRASARPGVTLGTFSDVDVSAATGRTETPDESVMEREVEANAGLVGESSPPA